MITTPQTYYFLIYKSDPRTSKVTINVDGDEHAIKLSHTSFLDYVESTAGASILGEIRETLYTYGVYWLFDRDSLSLKHLSPKSTETLINRQQQLQKKVAPTSTDIILPIDHLAMNPLTNPIPQPVDTTPGLVDMDPKPSTLGVPKI